LRPLASFSDTLGLLLLLLSGSDIQGDLLLRLYDVEVLDQLVLVAAGGKVVHQLNVADDHSLAAVSAPAYAAGGLQHLPLVHEGLHGDEQDAVVVGPEVHPDQGDGGRVREQQAVAPVLALVQAPHLSRRDAFVDVRREFEFWLEKVFDLCGAVQQHRSLSYLFFQEDKQLIVLHALYFLELRFANLLLVFVTEMLKDSEAHGLENGPLNASDCVVCARGCQAYAQRLLRELHKGSWVREDVVVRLVKDNNRIGLGCEI